MAFLFSFSERSFAARACLKNRSDVIQALDVDARAEGPDGQDHELTAARE
ncbi:hypothetical protein LWC05_04855 [Acetobacter sicerae]|uniref:Uncharacterized protein n=1 Tax=Acetobacter sicerae TaxID=85325 RepID=A0ABS8VR02_9PROT|nr:hypothetical protein [Acetobacter sicerae]MCE0743222.1 hypothetical protein [Acetobacter sicerae]